MHVQGLRHKQAKATSVLTSLDAKEGTEGCDGAEASCRARQQIRNVHLLFVAAGVLTRCLAGGSDDEKGRQGGGRGSAGEWGRGDGLGLV